MADSTDRVRPSDAIHDLIAGAVAEVEQDYTLVDVAIELAANDIGAVLVRDAHGVTGLVSERDLVTVVAGGRNLADVSAAEAMTTDLVWTSPNLAIRDVGKLMLKTGIRHVPVGDGRVALGVVSARKVLDVFVSAAG